jgi:beta-lactamase class A
MENCQTGSRRLRGGLPPGWTIANKTGNNGRDAAGDIAMLWSPDGVPTVVGVYTRGGNPGDDAFAPLFAAIAGMACAL